MEKNTINTVREKAVLYGSEALDNQDLLNLILSGKKLDFLTDNNINIIEYIAQNDMIVVKKNLGTIGMTLKAYHELSVRKSQKKTSLNSPEMIYDYLKEEMQFLEQEHLFLLSLNNKNEVISKDVVFKGTSNSCIVSPRELFITAIKKGAVKIIISHNHPGGKSNPSREDVSMTKRVKECGNLMNIPLLDHIIIGKGEYYSFKEEGLL